MSQLATASANNAMTAPKNIVADNIEFYNQFAATYDDQPAAAETARKQAEVLREMYPFDPATTTVMDFACGTGRIALELVPYAKQIVGVDITPAMVAKFNEKAAAAGNPAEKISAVCAELKGEPGELDGAKFDVVICALAFHHFPSIEDITRILASFLKPGGALLVVNIKKSTDPLGAEQSNPEWFHRVVAHKRGLNEDEMRAAFQAAALRDPTFKDLESLMGYGKLMHFFASAARKEGGH